jgi:hypothetical protein
MTTIVAYAHPKYYKHGTLQQIRVLKILKNEQAMQLNDQFYRQVKFMSARSVIIEPN